MNNEENLYECRIPINHNLLRVMPENIRDRYLPEFPGEVSDALRKIFKEIGGTLSVITTGNEEVQVIWKNDYPGQNPFEGIIGLLNRGAFKEAILLLEMFKSEEPDDIDILYNLGMAYSDLGELQSAKKNLKRLIEIKPDHVNGRVALGVALMRDGKNQEALKELEVAVQAEPENPWAQRNLGACHLKLENYEKAIAYLAMATEYNPEDERSWYGLGQAYEKVGNDEKADKAYRKVIELHSSGDIAEKAKEGLTRIAERTYKEVTHEAPRMDAVMYCLDALQKFEQMSKDEVQRVGIEIAMTGMCGIEVNKPKVKYSLQCLPGEFSGLQLLCLEYVAFRQIDTSIDIGFDLQSEYEMALQLFKREQDRR